MDSLERFQTENSSRSALQLIVISVPDCLKEFRIRPVVRVIRVMYNDSNCRERMESLALEAERERYLGWPFSVHFGRRGAQWFS